jgi:FtsZ-interacting cell division protein ZipA
MIYSTLKEVYNVDSFEKDKKHKKKNIDCESNRKNKDLYVEPAASFCAVPPSRKASMNNVKPFLDDELEQYLDYSSVAAPQQVPKMFDTQPAQPMPQSVQPVQQPAQQPVQQVANIASPVATAPPATVQAATPPAMASVAPADSKSKASQKDVFYKNLINISLFVFIGILIIFLCDQITEIAVNIGMKKTVSILEPYIARLEKLEKLKENNA